MGPFAFISRNLTFCTRRFSTPVLRHGHKGNIYKVWNPSPKKIPREPIGNLSPKKIPWEPIAFTIGVGSITCLMSGISLAGIAISRSRLVRRDGDSLLAKCRKFWWELGPRYRFFAVIGGANLAVFLLWKVSSLKVMIFMEKYFISSILQKGSLPLLLSTFSHQHPLHLGMCLFALYQFSPALSHILKERAYTSRSYIFYLTAGAFSASFSYYVRFYRMNNIGSLGASGAIMAIFALFTLNYPDASVILFLPPCAVKASTALGALVAVDVVGLVQGWRFLDHAGHLGGVLFAILFKYAGLDNLTNMAVWHTMKMTLWVKSFFFPRGN